MLISPPTLAIVTAKISRFDELSASDQLRAAALALKRDFNIDDPRLKLIARNVVGNASDRVLIAYTTQSTNANDAIDVRWLDAAASGTIHWIGAPHGFVVSDAGAATVDHWSRDEGIPESLMALIAQHSRWDTRELRIAIDDVRGEHIDEATLATWRASLGATIERTALAGTTKLTPLTAPPKAVARAERTSLDRVLVTATILASLCALLSLWRYATVSDVAARAANPGVSQAGDLWARTVLAVPALADGAKNASYGGGGWVIVAPKLERVTLPAIASALAANGLAAQIVTEPDTRIRVQRQ
jgi:hypothetical protein